MPVAAASQDSTQEQERDIRALDGAFSTLWLDPAADGNLVEIAYWCHVELLHDPDADESIRRHRLIKLNDARSRLAGVHTNGAAPHATIPSVELPVPRIARWALRGGIAAAATVTLIAALVLWLLDLDRATAITVFVGVGCIVAVLLWAFLAQAPRTASPLTMTPKEAYRHLRLRPGAPAPLVVLSHQYLRRGAITRDDAAELQVLDHAASVVSGSALSTTVAESPASGDTTGGGPAGADEGILELDGVHPERPEMQEYATELTDAAEPATDMGERSEAHEQPDGPDPAPELPSDSPAAPPSTVTASSDGTAGDRPSSGTTVGMARRERTPATRRPGGGLGLAGLLVVTQGDSTRSVDLIDGQIFTLGTGEGCEVRLNSDGNGEDVIAEEHARIAVRRGRVLFHHVAEEGISSINGSPVTWAVLEPGDELVIGAAACRFFAPNDPGPAGVGA